MTDFALAHATGTDARAIAVRCADQLGEPDRHNVGFVYATSPLEGSLAAIVDHLAISTGVNDWVGTVGHGVCATGIDYYDKPAVVAMTGRFPEGSYRLFASADEARRATTHAGFAVVHGDPRNARIIDGVAGLARERGAYLVGGLTASQGPYPQVVGTRLVEGGLSGILLGGALDVAVGLTQGCSPVGPVHEVTRTDGPIITTLDKQRAYDVLCEDVGIAEGADPRPWLTNVHAALPVAGSDTADYVVRNLTGIDPGKGLVAIANAMSTGDKVMFVRRDAPSAVKDLERMLADLRARVTQPPKAGLYFSCVARGPDLFETPAHEMKAIQRAFGNVPIVGFFGNGEISHDRVYGYTGVLTLFS
ncbi:MAG: FIST C-terminal domain-containing protein [Hyphomicrobiaceae bacterium]|nr:FIST C-terminal domain-containing protein [Hyphomicrobiaceae bacterium]